MKTDPVALYVGGAVLLAAGLYVLFCFTGNALANFLRVNDPIPNAEVLIVEAWIPGRFAESVKEEFSKGKYRYILLSGLAQDMDVTGAKETVSGNYSKIASSLAKAGLDSEKLKTVSIPNSTRAHKTFSMAKSAANWLHINDPSATRINVLTAGNHGRKTWCAYKRVFGGRFSVGILSFPQHRYPLRTWWTTRRGFIWQVASLANYAYATVWPLSLVPDP